MYKVVGAYTPMSFEEALNKYEEEGYEVVAFQRVKGNDYVAIMHKKNEE